MAVQPKPVSRTHGKRGKGRWLANAGWVVGASALLALPVVGFAILVESGEAGPASTASLPKTPFTPADGCERRQDCSLQDALLVRVTCRVLGPEGPIEGARCRFMATGFSVEGTTDRTGEASTMVPQGTKGRITAWAPGQYATTVDFLAEDAVNVYRVELSKEPPLDPADENVTAARRASDVEPTPKDWPGTGVEGGIMAGPFRVRFDCLQEETSWRVHFTPILDLPWNRTVIHYDWDFGFAGATSTSESPVHDYQGFIITFNGQPDDFVNVTLTVRLDNGVEGSAAVRCLLAVPKACPSDPGPAPGQPGGPPIPNDITVVAIVDSGINPYHWDFAARFVPDPAIQAVLCHHPSTWFPGYDSMMADSGCQELNQLDLSLGHHDPGTNSSRLHDYERFDREEWQEVRMSSPEGAFCNWIPGTKILSLLTYETSADGFEVASSHGTGAASVAVGNFHGTCPNCLLVFSQGLGDPGSDWAAAQDWIDAQSNSWGGSTTPPCPPLPPPPPPLPGCPEHRDGVELDGDVGPRFQGIVKGQVVFQSSGNGWANNFEDPANQEQNTLLNFHHADWVVTVGAFGADGSTLTSGKGVDVASLGVAYPSGSYGGYGLNATGMFSGTSNASPVVAGTYAHALDTLRRMTPGAHAGHALGVVLETVPGCGIANSECPLQNGRLTNVELMDALFKGAKHTTTEGGLGNPPQTTNAEEGVYWAEGWGGYWGKFPGAPAGMGWLNENARIINFVRGLWIDNDLGPVEANNVFQFMVADSYCRQQIWGVWADGYYGAGDTLPPQDPDWPIRTKMAHDPQTCPGQNGGGGGEIPVPW